MSVPREECTPCGLSTDATALSKHQAALLSDSPTESRQGPGSPPPHTPEILGPDHFCVVHHFALVGGDLQGGQHVVHSGEVGGGTRGHAVELPLQDVEARPPGHMGALQQRAGELRTSCQPSNRSDKLQGEGVPRARHQETAWQRPSTYWMQPVLRPLPGAGKAAHNMFATLSYLQPLETTRQQVLGRAVAVRWACALDRDVKATLLSHPSSLFQ